MVSDHVQWLDKFGGKKNSSLLCDHVLVLQSRCRLWKDPQCQSCVNTPILLTFIENILNFLVVPLSLDSRRRDEFRRQRSYYPSTENGKDLWPRLTHKLVITSGQVGGIELLANMALVVG
jgi:hypothetical protein